MTTINVAVGPPADEWQPPVTGAPLITSTGVAVDSAVIAALTAAAIAANVPLLVGVTIGTPGTGVAATRLYTVAPWTPGTYYSTGQLIINPAGALVVAITAFTSTGTYDPSRWAPPSTGGVSQVDWSLVTNKPAFAAIALSGAYADLAGRPALAAVATSGAYTDVTGRPGLAAVATSGSYTDLTGQPTIPPDLTAAVSMNTTTIAGLPAAYKHADPVTAITYNPDGSVASVTEDGTATTFTYNGDGTVATQTRAGVTRAYAYTAGNLTGVS